MHTAHPIWLVLDAFQYISKGIISSVYSAVTSLNDVQVRVLRLLNFPESIYTGLYNFAKLKLNGRTVGYHPTYQEDYRKRRKLQKFKKKHQSSVF
ncbi:hypothetical protein TI05_11100 [Achromatium sp. WMS3]|nr:hypothetical protein TI05_11100 [Achromatium sp. WMS3]